MIATFKGEVAEALWLDSYTSKGGKAFPADLRKVAKRKLAMVDAAKVLDDLKVPPGNRLEALKGDRAGQHSIRINDQWRVCFRWVGNQAHDVEVTDYH